jgi:hypothetical protein
MIAIQQHGELQFEPPVKRIEFSYPRVDLRHLKSGAKKFTRDHIVWWYNSIRVNTRGVRTIPEVEVMFKKLDNDIPSSGIGATHRTTS